MNREASQGSREIKPIYDVILEGFLERHKDINLAVAPEIEAHRDSAPLEKVEVEQKGMAYCRFWCCPRFSRVTQAPSESSQKNTKLR